MAEVNQIQNFADKQVVEDHTPSGSAVTAGQPFEVGSRAAFANNDIADGKLGAVQTRGLAQVVQKAETWAVGDDIWWDDDGDPVGGVAGSGAATKTPQTAAADFWLGSSRVVTAATDGTGVIDLNSHSKEATIADPAGGGTVDAEARTAIDALIDALENTGIIDNK